MTADNILKTIKDKEIEFVDLRFTDPRGKLQHLTQDISTIDADFLNDGTFFDGSSIAGWNRKVSCLCMDWKARSLCKI